MTATQDEFQKETEQLRQLIAQVNSTGEAAWEAGKLLKDMKDKKKYKNGKLKDDNLPYESFEEYTKKEFNITSQTAYSYIEIFDSFTKEEIGSVMLVSHLRVIAEVKDTTARANILKILKELSESPNEYKHTTEDVVAIVFLSGGVSELEKIKKIIDFVLNKSKEEDSRIKKANQQQKRKQKSDLFPDEEGVPFRPLFFKEVSEYYNNVPNNEMCVVGLFCVALPFLRNAEFLWNSIKVFFHSIDLLRAPFPDSIIRIGMKEKKKGKYEIILTPKYVEFEFKSYSYIYHKHALTGKKCDLIICWEDDLKITPELQVSASLQKIPPIISLKECFETGKIIVR
jgi:hypothetical protein